MTRYSDSFKSHQILMKHNLCFVEYINDPRKITDNLIIRNAYNKALKMKKSLKESKNTDIKHIVYGVKRYEDDGTPYILALHMIPMTEKEFDEFASSVTVKEYVYAIHF